MLRNSKAFSGYSVDDLDAATRFYAGTLGLDVTPNPAGVRLDLVTGGSVFLYPKPNHEPASFTVLNFPVDDIEATVDSLVQQGVEIERYDGLDHDDRGIATPPSGPRIAWFKDPAGNILSVMQG
jgi:predicted enzyme related to lactoylglutathione lyase